MKSLEEIAPFTVDKRDVTYKSKLARDTILPSKDKMKQPGPGHYNPNSSTGMVLKGTTTAGFGSIAPRDTMVMRDIGSNPFKDPTHRMSPSP